MRARPRTWPSIRPSRLSVAVLPSFLWSLRMRSIYPLGVYKTRAPEYHRRKLSAMSMTTAHHHHDAPAAGGVIDPVCGMTVDPHTAKHRAEHHGHSYYFCSAGCRSKFTADPQKYLGSAKAAEPVPDGTIYTCPMHPQIRQPRPGACPICGLSLIHISEPTRLGMISYAVFCL